RVEQVVQPLDEETVLATVVRTKGRYLGPLSHTDANRLLVDRLGRPLPQAAFVHPVEVGERLVALVYGENGEDQLGAEAASEMMVVIQALGQTLERLVRDRKAAAAASAAAPQPDAPQAGAAPATDDATGGRF